MDDFTDCAILVAGRFAVVAVNLILMAARSNRYDVSGNIEGEFVDAAQTVLANKKGVTDLSTLLKLEEEGLAKAYETLLTEVRADTPLSCEFIKYLHSTIFRELYEWAGRWRTLQISKADVTWPAAQFLDQSMVTFEREVLRKYPVSGLAQDDAFCGAAGHIQGEFLAIHPFREGNARTIKLATDILAAQTGRPLLVYDRSEAGVLRYIAAAKAAFVKRDFQPMTAVIRDALPTTSSE